MVFPERRELPKRREITKADGFVKDAEYCFAAETRFDTRPVASSMSWSSGSTDEFGDVTTTICVAPSR